MLEFLVSKFNNLNICSYFDNSYNKVYSSNLSKNWNKCGKYAVFLDKAFGKSHFCISNWAGFEAQMIPFGAIGIG